MGFLLFLFFLSALLFIGVFFFQLSSGPALELGPIIFVCYPFEVGACPIISLVQQDPFL